MAFEGYEDSLAPGARGSLGPIFGTLLELGGGCRFEVFGNATAEVRDATAELDMTFFPSPFQGK